MCYRYCTFKFTPVYVINVLITMVYLLCFVYYVLEISIDYVLITGATSFANIWEE